MQDRKVLYTTNKIILCKMFQLSSKDNFKTNSCITIIHALPGSTVYSYIDNINVAMVILNASSNGPIMYTNFIVANDQCHSHTPSWGYGNEVTGTVKRHMIRLIPRPE